MAQISKGDTFADGQQVTGARLNQLVDSSVLLVGAVTDQTLLTAATVAADDQMILSDTSAAVLKKTTVGDILGSSLPVVATTITGTAITGTTVTTPVINSNANSDIIVTPFDGANVTGKPFNSPDGIVTTVSSVAHGLTTGSMVQVTASNTAYSGLFKIVAINANEFTYTISPAVPLASGTCSYIRKATQRLVGNQTVSGSSIIAGNETVEGNLRVVGNLNIIGTLTFNGIGGYVLTEVSEQTMTPWAATTPTFYSSVWTSTAFTKPSNEIWVFETVASHRGVQGYYYEFAFRYGSQTARSGQYLSFNAIYDYGNGSIITTNVITNRWVVPAGTAIASDTVTVDAYAGNATQQALFQTVITNSNITNTFGGTVAPSKFRIYKYKPA